MTARRAAGRLPSGGGMRQTWYMARPERTEAAPYYSKYIDRVPDGDIAGILESQLDEVLALSWTSTRRSPPATSPTTCPS